MTEGAAPAADALAAIQAAAGLEALGKVALLPAVLTVVFAIIFATRLKSNKQAA